MMVLKVLVNKKVTNEYINGAIELRYLKLLLRNKMIEEDSYYYLKDKIIKEYKIF